MSIVRRCPALLRRRGSPTVVYEADIEVAAGAGHEANGTIEHPCLAHEA